MKYLIVNADDFGMSPEINKAIIEAHRNGIVTSASIMANMPFFKEALEMAHENSNLGVGIHLNILRGTPLSETERIRSLLKDDSREFLGDIFKLLFRIFTNRLKLDEIKLEWRAQIEMVLNAGLHLTHLDSEKHLHSLPALMNIIIRLAKEFGVYKVRLVKEAINKPRFDRQLYKSFLLNRLAMINKKKLDSEGIRYTDNFIGVQVCGGLNMFSIKQILNSIPEGVTEFMCHPGGSSRHNNYGNYYIDPFRKSEFEALTSSGLKELILANNIRLITFEDI